MNIQKINSLGCVNYAGKKQKTLLKTMTALSSALLISNACACSAQASNKKPQIQIQIEDYSNDYYEDYRNSKRQNEKLDKAAKKADSYLNIPLFGSYLNGNKGVEKMREAVKDKPNLVNGYIDEEVIQGIVGDCWLLTAIHNLSYTPAGARALHDAIKVNKEGNIEVYFKGPDKTYTVTKEELIRENQDYTLLSHGDDDMLVFEIAARKYRQDVADGKIEIDKSLPDYMYKTNTESFDVLHSGQTRQGYWLISGIVDSIATVDIEETKEIFEKYRKNPDNSLLDVEIAKDKIVKDINGSKVRICAAHGYGVKAMTKDTITLISATNSNQEIVLPIDTVLNDLSILEIIYCEIE